MRIRTLFVCLSIMPFLGCSDRKVTSVSLTVPEFSAVDITDRSRFINDLKLSPLWKVDKDWRGMLRAQPRWIESNEAFSVFQPVFLFELLAEENPVLPSDYVMRHGVIWEDDTFSVFSAEIVFGRPVGRLSHVDHEGNLNLAIYDSDNNTIGQDSYSEVGLKLSSAHEIYLVLHEQGSDRNRATTLSKLKNIVEHIIDMKALPLKYRVDETYQRFFDLFFQSGLKDHHVRRFTDRVRQGRDTFCGYFRSKLGGSYDGVNVRVSHEEWGECTQRGARLRKAEHLGNVHYDSDHLFFLIEDNKVVAPQPHAKRYGWATGTGTFLATLEILDRDENVLFESPGWNFTSWER